MTTIKSINTINKITSLYKQIKALAPSASMAIHHCDMSTFGGDWLIEMHVSKNDKIKYQTARKADSDIDGLVFFD